MEFLRQNHPAYRDIVVNSAALEILPQNGSIATEIAILETDTVSSELLPAEDQEQYIDDPIHVGVPDLQQNDLEIDQLRQEIRNQRNQRRRPQGFTEIQAPTCQSTPLDEFDQNLPLFSSAFPYLFPYGQAEFRTPRQRAIKLVDYCWRKAPPTRRASYCVVWHGHSHVCGHVAVGLRPPRCSLAPMYRGHLV